MCLFLQNSVKTMQIKSFFLISQSIFRKNIKKIGNFAEILVLHTCFLTIKRTFRQKNEFHSFAFTK